MRKKDPSKPRYPWRKMQLTDYLKPAPQKLIAAVMAAYKLDREAAIAHLADHEARSTYYVNDLYQVERINHDNNVVSLNIRRRDGLPIMRDWRHFQNIKNDILGRECEAIELYPAESRLVDTSNKYHLWGVADPSFRFPVGFRERDVSYEDTPTVKGMRQRPL